VPQECRKLHCLQQTCSHVDVSRDSELLVPHDKPDSCIHSWSPERLHEGSFEAMGSQGQPGRIPAACFGACICGPRLAQGMMQLSKQQATTFWLEGPSFGNNINLMQIPVTLSEKAAKCIAWNMLWTEYWILHKPDKRVSKKANAMDSRNQAPR
jgi:hypothetical protein